MNSEISLAARCAPEVEVLRKSVTFAMSLGARELFHTNFLAFLMESDDEDLGPVQDAIREALGWPRFADGVQVLSRCAVWRETNNLDLVIVELCAVDAVVRPTGRVLIVEAKLKSIPNSDQLSQYDLKRVELHYPEGAVKDETEWSLVISSVGLEGITVKADGNKKRHFFKPERRLLSIEGRTLSASNGEALEWPGVSWAALCQCIESVIGQVRSPLFGRILSDYLMSLQALAELVKKTRSVCDEVYANSRALNYGFLRGQTLAPQFQKLRLNDFLGKSMFDYWMNKYVFPAASIEPPTGWFFESYVNYSRGTPGFGIEIVRNDFLSVPRNQKKAQIGLGVQLQNCEFRAYVVAKPEYPDLDGWIEEHPILLSNWFGSPLFNARTPVGRDGHPIMPALQHSRSTNLKVFGVTKFLYSKVDVDSETVGAIQDEVVRMMALACELAPRLSGE